MDWEQLEKDSEVFINDFNAENKKNYKAESKADYFGIGFVGCQHIGNHGTDYKKMRQDAELINSLKETACIFLGDAYDNFIIEKLLSAIVNQKVSPTDQKDLFQKYLEMFDIGKIIGIISGNHEYWTKKKAGIDILKMICEKNAITYNAHEMIYTIDFGVKYVIKTRHKYRYNSSLNYTHTIKRMYDMGDDTFDIGVIAHHHVSAIEDFYRHGKKITACRCGTYKVADVYARETGFNDGTPEMPFVIIRKSAREIISVLGIDKGIKLLKSLNNVKVNKK